MTALLRYCIENGGFFLPYLEEFNRLYPEVVLDLDFSDRMVDLVAEGFDVAIRGAKLEDSSLISRPLCHFSFKLVAGSDYLATAGEPKSIQDLLNHQCLHYRYPQTGRLDDWQLPEAIVLPQSMVCNHLETLLYFVKQGKGIACIPEFCVNDGLNVVLPHIKLRQNTFHLVFPSNRYLSPKVRTFVDFMVQAVK
ncbi:LysR substrate-binding domain-containing protein [Rodentibacter myodis]|uniref:LysR substrate-binding domain-containing protein n=1 Tax=Rodentibacter myodis TaxID=1907939 RepID=A0A1V3JGQ0_9PAST|nr:LysR substrate-binding domain-containing protein [Rodentibacter myodis]OOF55619.1 hypothetical protein BKL49_11295 [Rodentibacter myodis]